jgi:AcrR family transcriptional regulator
VSRGPSRRGTLRRAQILDAAEELFGAAGYEATSLRTLAKQVGITHAGILRHFASKEDVLHTLLNRLGPSLAAPGSEPTGAAACPRPAQGGQLRRPVELYATLLGEAAVREHPAHDFIEQHLRLGRQCLDRTTGGRGIDALATWDGLLLLWLYLPERVSPAGVLAAPPVRASEGAGAAVAKDWIAEAVTPAPEAAREHSATTPIPTDRVDEIIEAAVLAFSRHGYQATSLRRIAGELGLTHGTLLYYFDTKEALLEAVLNRRDRHADAAFITPATAYDKVYNVYRRAVHNEAHAERVAFYSAMLCEATSPAHPAYAFFATRYTRILDTLAAEIRSLQAQGLFEPVLDSETEAARLTALWDGLQIHARHVGTGDVNIPERLLRHLNGLIDERVPAQRRSDLLMREP